MIFLLAITNYKHSREAFFRFRLRLFRTMWANNGKNIPCCHRKLLGPVHCVVLPAPSIDVPNLCSSSLIFDLAAPISSYDTTKMAGKCVWLSWRDGIKGFETWTFKNFVMAMESHCVTKLMMFVNRLSRTIGPHTLRYGPVTKYYVPTAVPEWDMTCDLESPQSLTSQKLSDAKLPFTSRNFCWKGKASPHFAADATCWKLWLFDFFSKLHSTLLKY